MKALISPAENNRICEITSSEFAVAMPLHWVDCADNVTCDWIYDGANFIEPIAPEPANVIPTTVSMRQARLALLQAGLLDAVNTAINQGGEADKITWEYATEVNRSDSLVVNMALALNLTESSLDNLFTVAATL